MNSKQKGARGEREWAAFCREQGYDCRRTAQYCGNTGDASDVVGLPRVHQEVKRVEALNLYSAVEQAVRDAKNGLVRIVAHRKNDKPWLVTMLADEWFLLYREWDAGNDVHLVEQRGGFYYCPGCGKWFSPDHAERKPTYCEDCGCRLGWD